MAAAPERPGRRAAPGGPGRELMARVFSEVLSSISFAICAAVHPAAAPAGRDYSFKFVRSLSHCS